MTGSKVRVLMEIDKGHKERLYTGSFIPPCPLLPTEAVGTVCLRYCLRDWEEKGLDVADFRGCGFENTSFAGAVLTNAVFPAQSVPFIDIDAQRKHDAAVQARDEIFYKYGVGNPSAQCDAEVLLADLAIEKAKKEQEDAEQALRAAKAEAERRSRNVEIRKRLMRNSADKDTAYVVYQARIECTYGMRESYLSLKSTHGVMTKEIPQMTVKDTKLNTNIINFGGCRSMENPSVERAAEKARNGANSSIEEKKDWRDTAVAVVKAARIAICPGKAIIEHFLSTFKKVCK